MEPAREMLTKTVAGIQASQNIAYLTIVSKPSAAKNVLTSQYKLFQNVFH